MDTKLRQLFPLGKAYGRAFCNREDETAQLVGNIQTGRHTLLVAPRRYGKSSLAERAIEKAHLPFVKVNFHLCTSEEEVAWLIVDGVVNLIGLAIGKVEKLATSIKKYLSQLEPLLAFGGDKVSLKLTPKRHVNYAVVIAETLELIEKLLRERDKRAVIFLDEFQEIALLSKLGSMEGAFRTAAQEMQQLTVIFSGSVRSLLLSMFEDESRPLYKLCRKIKLDRISARAYEKHIQKIAVATWGGELDGKVFNKIMELSNRHPYYVNYLCDTIWEIGKSRLSANDVEHAWKRVVREEWSDALKELADLPLGQRRLLKYVANNEVKSLQSQETAARLSMAPSSIATALNALIEKDYVEQDMDANYRIINPLLLAVLRGVE